MSRIKTLKEVMYHASKGGFKRPSSPPFEGKLQAPFKPLRRGLQGVEGSKASRLRPFNPFKLPSKVASRELQAPLKGASILRRVKGFKSLTLQSEGSKPSRLRPFVCSPRRLDPSTLRSQRVEAFKASILQPLKGRSFQGFDFSTC